MLEELFLEINNKYDSNIYIHQCGQEICGPNHSYGPAIRDHYLIHFIIDGKGTYYFNDKEYHLKKYDCFLISPGDVTFYQADEDEPWHYSWVGFNGIKASKYLDLIGLNRENPILTVNDSAYVQDCLYSIFESSKITRGGEVRMLGNLYLFLSKLIEETDPKDESDEKDNYILKAIEFIEMNYSRNITVQEIAEHINLNRSYFSILFKKQVDVSPQTFLIHYRINKACELMKMNDNLSIGNIARSIGYDDQLAFSKIFKKVKGITPTAFREQNDN